VAAHLWLVQIRAISDIIAIIRGLQGSIFPVRPVRSSYMPGQPGPLPFWKN